MVFVTTIRVERLVKDAILRLWIPDIENVYRHLIERQGFEIASPSIPRGEKYSLRRVLSNVWKLHVRLYDDGFIDAEVEVRREFMEHLTPRRLNVVYEALNSTGMYTIGFTYGTHQ